MELLKTIKDEWAVISTTPFTFLTLAALMFAAAYFAARWRYMALVDQAKAKQETLAERLHLRSEQTESYREKASKYDQMLAEVVDSGATELRDRTLNLVVKLREFIGRYQRLDTSSVGTRWFEETHAGTDSGEEQRWARYARLMINSAMERNNEYEQRFKTDVLILRDELLSRLPDYMPDDSHGLTYEDQISHATLNYIADDLERMANLL
ncbi:hypothetical protein C4K04_1448 [Pseudomonas chlororaphis]|uniref:Uncharacterized protein n=1 Tax=Pseudomonas chlororaphis TaxID=587753 RepID=A0A3G7TKM4_9PSED|nr:hypothetical protein [Pseudomonas chlororaphis]AZE47138.1 hypothetical protein C4K04_1448 [Pseudomonas chlororaphis]